MGVLDDNMDGRLDMSELRGKQGVFLKANFAALDANHDGVLDKDELAALRRGRSQTATPGSLDQGAPARPASRN